MNKFALITLAVFSTGAFAQGAEKNYGDLVPVDHFDIKQDKTTLKDNADISNYKIVVSPEKEEFSYSVNSVRTPRGVFKSKKDFKLTVQRSKGKIDRITSLSFNSGEDRSGSKAIHTTSLTPSGSIASYTNCSQDYGLGLFSIRKDASDFQCVTINKSACEYLKSNKIDQALVNEINSCSVMTKKFSEHQDNLDKLTSKESKADLEALRKIDKRLLKTSDFYELESKTLENLSSIVSGYGRAIEHCEYLEGQGYFKEEEVIPASSESPNSSSKQ